MSDARPQAPGRNGASRGRARRNRVLSLLRGLPTLPFMAPWRLGMPCWSARILVLVVGAHGFTLARSRTGIWEAQEKWVWKAQDGLD